MLEAEIIKECELTDIQDVPDSQLPYFWNYKNCDEYTIDSTMIRVAEWCKLTGFDRYWNKLTFDMELTIDRLPHKKLHLIQFMYSICRSELAMEKMRNKLSKLCELISVPYIDENDFFWEDRSSYNSKKGTTKSPYIASGLIFILIRLGKRKYYEGVINKAKEYLLSSQDIKTGGWHLYSNREEISIETTALCIHALGILNCKDLNHIMRKGVQCLYDKQHEWGLWFEEVKMVNEAFLSVLVLDSIEIAERNTDIITFDFNASNNIEYIQEKVNTIINNNTIMGDQYTVSGSQVGVIGKQAKVEGNIIQQTNYEPPLNFNFDTLSTELGVLKEALLKKAKTADELRSLVQIADAEEASNQKQYPMVLKYLKIAGKWALETANEIGFGC